MSHPGTESWRIWFHWHALEAGVWTCFGGATNRETALEWQEEQNALWGNGHARCVLGLTYSPKECPVRYGRVALEGRISGGSDV
jgi:hypothetical protein